MFKVYLLLSVLLSICSICGLFQVRYEIDSVNKSLSMVYDDIHFVSEEIDVLDTELSYISSPARIEYLAGRYLKMEPLKVSQVSKPILREQHTVLASGDE